MASRVRVILATCLALSIAIPVAPAAARATAPVPGSSSEAARAERSSDVERPTRGQAKGRRTDPFAAGAARAVRHSAPTKIHPTIIDTARSGISRPETTLTAGPASAFFLDGAPTSGPGAQILKLYTEASSAISLTADAPGGVTFSISENTPNGDWWYLELEAAPGDELLPGAYEGAVRAASNGPGQPGLDFYGNGVGCNVVTGRFVIGELTRGAADELTSLAASFEYHCEGGSEATFGDFRFMSAVPVQGLTIAPRALEWGRVSIGQSKKSVVQIANAGSAAVAIASIAISGPDASRFTLTQETCPATLSSGTSCSATVQFTPTTEGARQASLVLDDDTARGSHIIPLTGDGHTPGIADASGRPAAQIVSVGAGISDALHETFYACVSTPCVEPPDPTIAVGPDHLMQTAGALVRVTNRFGGGVLTADIFSWFGQPDDIDGYADVTAAYHAGTDRWFGASTSWYCGPDPVGYLDVAISSTANPAGAWFVYSFPFPNSIPSSPTIGLSADKLVVSSREVSISDVCAGQADSAQFLGSSLTIVDTGDIVAFPSSLYYWATDPEPGLVVWRPAHTPTSSVGTVYLIALISGIGPSAFGYATVTGSVTPDTLTISPVSNLTTAGVVSPPNLGYWPEDPGGYVSTGPGVLPDPAASADGRLAFTIDHECIQPGEMFPKTCVRVVELNTPTNPAAQPTVRQDVVIAEQGVHSFEGGVTYSAAGDLHVVYSSSSHTQPIGVRHVYQRADDQPGRFSSVATIVNGQAPYSGDAWGDVVVAAQDPVDAFAIWQADAYTASNGRWATRITQMRLPGATFQPVSPARLLDSRTGNGLSGTFVSGTPRSFQVTGRGGVPASAIAVTGNLTVVGQSQAGYVSLTPTRDGNPKTSTINFPAGDTRANNVTISLGKGGKLSAVFKAAAGARTHLIFDVTGYFVRNNSGATYLSLGPVRLLDTRVGNGLNGTFKANMPQSVQITGRGGVPTGAKAISANLTVVGQTGAGYVTLSPTTQTDPATSTINFPLGDTRANGLTVPLSNDGKVAAVYKAAAGKTTHLILDVTGYYVADPSGSRYVPLNPARTLDSRFNVGLNGTFKSSMPRTLKIDGRRGIPNDADAITGNLTIVGQTGSGYVAITTAPTATPATSTLNAPVGDVRANGVTVPIAADGTDSLTYVSGAGRVTHLILDLTGYFR